jgi:hypothetical protein
MSGTANDLATLNQQIADAEAPSSGTYTITISADIAYAWPSTQSVWLPASR